MRRHPWLTAAIVFVVLGAVLYLCVEWRAEQRWQRYAADARARGGKLLLTDFARPKIPDDQNFAALPMMRKAFAGGPDSEAFKLPQRPGPPQPGDNIFSTPRSNPPTFGDPIKGQRMDWLEWQKYFQEVGFLTETSDNPARDVLGALEHYAPQFQEWSQWRTRPQCRFPLDFTKGQDLTLSHLSTFQHAAKLFSLRMRAHLAPGDSAAAYADFQEGLQAYRGLKDEPMLISGLVRVAVLHVVLGGVGEGLQNRAWTDTELKQIESDLAVIAVWDDYRLALVSERGFLNSTNEAILNASMRDRGKMLSNFNNFLHSNPTPVIVFELIPRSVFRENQLRLNQYLDELSARVGAGSQTFNPNLQTPSSPEGLTGTFDEYYYFLSRVSGPVYSQIERRYIQVQTELDQARLACALERFRLARGAYPEGLTELVPDFIDSVPTDIYARAPYRYQRVGKSSFRLYSVGENRRDDGGQFVPGVPERQQPDAIWLYAP